jgi:hypothetical protein
VLAAREHAAEQNRRVDGRNLGVPDSRTRVQIRPVVEEPPVGRHLRLEKAKSGDHALVGLAGGHELALFADADRGQAESRGRDACGGACVGCRTHVNSVSDESGNRVRLVPEVAERGQFNLIQQAFVLRRQGIGFPQLAGCTRSVLPLGLVLCLGLRARTRRQGCQGCREGGSGAHDFDQRLPA